MLDEAESSEMRRDARTLPRWQSLRAIRCLVGVAAAVALGGCRPGDGTASMPEPSGMRDPAADRAAISAVFEAYTARLAADDTVGAVALIDRETMKFYESLRQDALTLTATELRSRPLREQVTIVMFRQDKTADSLRTKPVAELTAASLMPLVDPARLRLYEIELAGDRAVGQAGIDSFEARVPFEFRRDPDGWRINFIAATHMAADRLIDGDDADDVRAFLARYYGVDVETLYAPPR